MSKISNNVEHLDFMLHFLFESFTKTLKKSRIYRKITSLQNIADWRLFFFDCTTLMLFWHDIIPVFCTLKLEMDSLHITLILLHRDLAQSGVGIKSQEPTKKLVYLLWRSQSFMNSYSVFFIWTSFFIVLLFLIFM